MVMCELTVIGEWTIGDITSAAASIVASRSTESLILPKEWEDEPKFSG